MQILTQLVVLAFVVSTMLGVGLMLTVRDISVALHDRRWLVRALLANFVVLPAIALGVSRMLELDPVLAASLLVLATAPGGPVLVKLATLVKGDPALAVASDQIGLAQHAAARRSHLDELLGGPAPCPGLQGT